MTDCRLTAKTLTGRHVRLEPLTPRHRAALIAAADNPDLWKYVPFDAAAGYAGKLDGIEAAMAAGREIAFAVVRLADETVVGSAAFMAIAPEHARVEIGAIWYRKDAQGTAVNPECMLLMLEHAFAAGFNRVEFKADSCNARSRAALRKLGATEEGIMRQHMWLPQGRFRDSVYYSILAAEWPVVHERLKRRLVAFD